VVGLTTSAATLALGGGALIGLAAAALLLLNGRILGVSGILNGVLDRAAWPGRTAERGDIDWRIALLVGVVVGAGVAGWASGAPAPRTGFPGWALAVAGLLVGAGTRLGSGCTSGHGICGIARLSPRSIVATAVFMATGFATVYLLRHVLGALA